jgi:hypothetical protein
VLDRRWLAIDLAVKVATILLLGWAVLNGDLPQFATKAFAGRALTYPVALLVVPVGWLAVGRRRGLGYPVWTDILLGLPFLIDVLGNALNLYDSVDWWDDANHLVNWFLHTAGIALLLRSGQWGRWTRVGLAIGWAATTAILWEIAEYEAFVRNSAEVVTAYSDTIGDLALGLLGGTIAALVIGSIDARRPLEPPEGAD